MWKQREKKKEKKQKKRKKNLKKRGDISVNRDRDGVKRGEEGVGDSI